MKVCEKCGSPRLRLEVPPDFEEFEVCRDCGHIQEEGREDL
jgi:transcription initiation factor TFIIIB Brf1 subunit/transcription initiation factor TFIIB